MCRGGEVDEKAKLQKKIESVNQMQLICFLPGIIFAVTGRGQAIDAVHARNAALFRLACIVLGLVVFVVLQILKAGWKKQLKALEQASTAQSAKVPIPPPF